MLPLAASSLSLNASALDYAILGIYFLVVLGIGAVARLSIKTDVDFFLSGRSLPAWITGLAFVAAPIYANLFGGDDATGEGNLCSQSQHRLLGEDTRHRALR